MEEKLICTYHMNPAVPMHEPLDYGGHTAEGEVRLDCSLGVDPKALDTAILDSLNQQNNHALESYVKSYPHDDAVKEALAAWHQSLLPGREWLAEECFVMGNGSYGILSALNRLFLGPGRRVLGCGPQFTAYVDSVYYTGAVYEACLLRPEDRYRFDAERYLSRMSEAYDLFILENPNNPTGRLIPKEEIEKIAEKAASLRRVLIVDEAYADYLSPDETAVDLLRDHPNIIVTRSFSKGFGMAGIRAGYAVCAPGSGIAPELEKAALPFQCNSFARKLAEAALYAKMGKNDPFGTDGIRKAKAAVRDGIAALYEGRPQKLFMAETSLSVPIFMLYTKEEAKEGTEADLFELFRKCGVLTVSCRTYPGLDARAVRLMLPETDSLPVLMDAIRAVASMLEEL